MIAYKSVHDCVCSECVCLMKYGASRSTNEIAMLTELRLTVLLYSVVTEGVARPQNALKPPQTRL